MPPPRVLETDEGIQGEFNVEIYDKMQRRLRDKGWIETQDIIQSGNKEGLALEIGVDILKLELIFILFWIEKWKVSLPPNPAIVYTL